MQIIRNDRVTHMEYPLISEYIDAILSAEDNLATLNNLRPVLDDRGRPVMSSGNFAVVFKMRSVDSGRCYAVKCFIKDQEGRAEAYQRISQELEFVSSPYILHVQYLENELFVDTTQTEQEEFPVLKMEWVEGKPLDAYLRENIYDNYALEMLTYRFCRMGAFLLSQPFAHGDLKPDNILVRENDELVLVDYDGMFVPSMEGQKARELGSPDFRHPLRDENLFDSHIDDFAIASIALSLKAIALDPSMLEKYGAADRLLFSADDYRDLNDSPILRQMCSSSSDSTLVSLFSAFLLASAKINLVELSYRVFLIHEPEDEIIRTEITDEERKDGVRDEYGALYTKDWKKLIEGPFFEEKYEIKQGTEIIGDKAFDIYFSITNTINIPNSVKYIGKESFNSLKIKQINIPDSVKSIGDSAFRNCSCLTHVMLGKGVKTIGERAFEVCSCLQEVCISGNVLKSIGERAFYGCDKLNHIKIPNSVRHIGGGIFNGALMNPHVVLDSDSYFIESNILYSKQGNIISCWSKNGEIKIQDNIKQICNYAFISCLSLQSIVISNNVTRIGKGAFEDCRRLSHIVLPSCINKIEPNTFCGCLSLRTAILSNSINCIGDYAFGGCWNLGNINIPEYVTSIGICAFSSCKSLRSVTIPRNVKTIGTHAFSDDNLLSSVVFLGCIENIGDYIFGEDNVWGISFPKKITIPAGCKIRFDKILYHQCELIEQ